MAFPTIPTVAAGRVVSRVDTAGTATKTSPNLNTLTKNAGDLLIAIVVEYDGNSTNAEFSSWGGGFTEFLDSATTTTMGIGCAYKESDGTETGTFTVTTADTSANDYAFFLLSIPGGAKPTTQSESAPEGGARASGTTGAADPAAFDPAGWAAEDTLWISVCGSGEDATTGSFTGTGATAPTNYSDVARSGISADVVGGVEAAVAFRQLNASSENVGTWSAVDVSSARNAAVVIAVRPTNVHNLVVQNLAQAQTITGEVEGHRPVFNLLESGGSATDASNYDTGTATPLPDFSSGDSVYLACLDVSKTNAEPDTPTLTGMGLTWALEQGNHYKTGGATTNLKQFIFRAQGDASAATIDIDFGGITQLGCRWDIVQVRNVPVGNNGADAIRQSEVAAGTVANNSFSSPTLAGALNGNSLPFILAGLNTSTAGSLTPESGNVELSEDNHSTPAQCIATHYKPDGFDTSPSVQNTSGSSLAMGTIALEVVAFSEVVALPPRARRMRRAPQRPFARASFGR